MAAFRRGGLFITPWMQCRHRGKFQTKHPKPRTVERRLFEIVSQPINPSMLLDKPAKACTVLEEEMLGIMKNEENKYEQFLIRNCKKMFDDHSIIVVFQPASMKREEEKTIHRKLMAKGFTIKHHLNQIVRQSIAGTKWSNLGTLLQGPNLYVVASDDAKVSDLVKIVKKNPDITMLGGLVGDVMLTKEGLLRYANLPSLDVARGQFVGILNSALNRTTTLLNSHQQKLSMNLEQYVKDQEGESLSATSTTND